MQILNIILIFSVCSATLADNSCVFEHPIKGIINLTSVGLRNGQARFRNLSTTSSSSFTYSFNPCFSFTENNCENAAVCQISSDRQYSYLLAKQNSSKWTIDSNSKPILTYTHGSKMVFITMICSDIAQDVLDVVGEDYENNHYSMHLQSPCACWGGCVSSRPDTTTSRTTTHSIYYTSCMYHDSRYGTIDLSSIGSITGKPAFKDIASTKPDNYRWSYNPCYNFSEGSCRNAAGCQIDQFHGISYTIGLQEYAYWINMNSTNDLIVWIRYLAPPYNKHLSVQLICDRISSSHHLQILGETPVGESVMQLRSPCACWDGCIKPTPSPSTFNWHLWMRLGIMAGVVVLLFLIIFTCSFCSRSYSNDRYFIINDQYFNINDQLICGCLHGESFNNEQENDQYFDINDQYFFD